VRLQELHFSLLQLGKTEIEIHVVDGKMTTNTKRGLRAHFKLKGSIFH
jgi:hypothetical protein